jgi:hypothetical protein
MTILTGRELEVLIGLRTSWGRLYSKELARLLNEDDTKRAVDLPSPKHFPKSMATALSGRQPTLEMNAEDAESLGEHMRGV